MAHFHYRFHANLHAHVPLPKFVLELTVWTALEVLSG